MPSGNHSKPEEVRIEEVGGADLEAGTTVFASSLSRTQSRPRSRYSEKGGDSGYLHEGASESTHDAHAEQTVEPNRWWKFRQMIREPAAEFLGVMILIIFGTGVDCQVVLSGKEGFPGGQRGEYISINFGWGIGTAFGVWVSAGISGGHINPAVTLALAAWRGFPWKKVPAYIFAQVMGGVVGAALVYANYFHALDLFEGPGVRTLSTAGLFSTYALPYMTNVSAFFSEFLATAVLLMAVLSITDRRNSPPPPGLVPLVLFVLILGIGASLGMETGYAINPARDLGPRLLTSMVGYGKEVYTFRNHYWLWCPVLAPILGAQAGTIVYDALLYDGHDSLVNKPDAAARKRLAAGATLPE